MRVRTSASTADTSVKRSFGRARVQRSRMERAAWLRRVSSRNPAMGNTGDGIFPVSR